MEIERCIARSRCRLTHCSTTSRTGTQIKSNNSVSASILAILSKSMIRLFKRSDCSRICSRKRIRFSQSSTAPSRSVSVQTLITARGVFNSWETFATNSCLSLSSLRNSVVSCSTKTAPRVGFPGNLAACKVRLRFPEVAKVNSVRLGSGCLNASSTKSIISRFLTNSQSLLPSKAWDCKSNKIRARSFTNRTR